jgi:hypothetical protein
VGFAGFCFSFREATKRIPVRKIAANRDEENGSGSPFFKADMTDHGLGELRLAARTTVESNDRIALKGKRDIGEKINTQILQPLIDPNERLARSDFPR